MSQTHYLPIYKFVNEEDRPRKIKKIDQYLLVDKLGAGYFSKVYLALKQGKKEDSKESNAKYDTYYAAKAIHIHESFHNSRTFEREIKILNILNHPNIIKLHAIFYAPSTDMAYMMMEWANCGPLQQLITNKIQLNERTIASIFLQIALALLYLHSKGIVHRDVKPSNILLFSDGTAKLADFGISHFEESAEAVCGTPSYQAPDLFEGVHSDSFEFFPDSIDTTIGFDQKITDLQRIQDDYISSSSDSIIIPRPRKRKTKKALKKINKNIDVNKEIINDDKKSINNVINFSNTEIINNKENLNNKDNTQNKEIVGRKEINNIKDNLCRECINSKGNLSKEVINGKDNLGKEVINGKDNLCKEVINGKDNLCKEVINDKDNLSKEVINGKDNLCKEVINSKDNLGKEVINGNDNLSKEVINSKENLGKDISNCKESTKFNEIFDNNDNINDKMNDNKEKNECNNMNDHINLCRIGQSSNCIPVIKSNIDNSWKIDPKKSDVWSLGISMYQTAYGVLPYDGHNVYEIINKINNSPLIIPQSKERKYSPLFVDLIKKMLKKTSTERLSIEEVINHPFFIRYQSSIIEKENKENSCSINVSEKRFMKKIELNVKPIQPPNYFDRPIVKIDAIDCTNNCSFLTKPKKKHFYSFYRYTFIDDNI